MKNSCCLYMMIFFLVPTAMSQETLVFRGTVKCYIQNDQRATKGASNVVVVPGFIPNKSGMTGQQGYYELNTAMPMQKLEGKYVMIYYVSSCRECEMKKTVFVSEDQVRQSSKNLSYLTVETLQMRTACKNAELKSLLSDKIYDSIVKLPVQNLDKVSALNVVTASPGLLNVLTNIIAAPLVINAGTFFADTAGLSPGKIKGYGRFLFASPMILTANTGFNFAPFRDLSEAVFWNPSSLALSHQKGGLSAFTNIRNNAKLSGFVKINDRITIGAGGIYTTQDNFRETVFRQIGGNSVNPLHFQKLKEYAVFLSPSYKINNKIGVGLGLKSIWQNFTIPNRVEVSQNPDRNDFFDSTVKHQKFDVDFSVSYNITRSLKAGVNLMNLAGTELFADAFAAGKKILPKRNIRSYGLGLCYKWKQFNFGTDLLLAEDELYDVTLGINYIPFNNALLSGGFAFRQKSFSASFRMKYFRLSYVNDNGLMVNEKRRGKANILNGQLYSGIALTF